MSYPQDVSYRGLDRETVDAFVRITHDLIHNRTSNISVDMMSLIANEHVARFAYSHLEISIYRVTTQFAQPCQLFAPNQVYFSSCIFHGEIIVYIMKWFADDSTGRLK